MNDQNFFGSEEGLLITLSSTRTLDLHTNSSTTCRPPGLSGEVLNNAVQAQLVGEQTITLNVPCSAVMSFLPRLRRQKVPGRKKSN